MSTAPASRPAAYRRLVHFGIEQVFRSLLIPACWRLYGRRDMPALARYLRGLPAGTVGRSVADCLHAHDLQLIPGYEDHDLKHVLLGYAMTPEDELKLKAFTLGNGDYTLPSLALLLIGALLPGLWPELRANYRRGRQVRPGVFRWRLRDYAARDLAELRREIGLVVDAETGPPLAPQGPPWLGRLSGAAAAWLALFS